MQVGVIAIALSVLCLLASFTLPVPSWINLVGIGLAIVGLALTGLNRKKGKGE